MKVLVLRRVLPEVLPEFLALVPEEKRHRFLQLLSQLLRKSDDTEVEPWLPALFDNDDEAIGQATLLLQDFDAYDQAPILLNGSQPVQGARYVNTCFTRAHSELPLPATTCMAAGRRYRLRIDIGPWSTDSIVENPVRFPADHLPATRVGYWLLVAVNSVEFVVDSRQRPFFLPARGPGWICQCPPGTRHTCRAEERSPYLFIDIATPATQGRADLRLTITYGGGLVQSQFVTADIREVERSGAGTRARIDFTLAGLFDTVGTLPQRDMNVTTEQGSDGSHLLTIGGLSSERISFRLTEEQMRDAGGAARRALRDLQEQPVPVPVLRWPGRRKGEHRLVADLARLAPLGRRLWDLLLADRPQQRAVLKRRMRSPVTVQVARTGRIGFVFPWALVYDIGLEDGNPDAHHACRIVDELSSPAPPECPYEREHRLNTLCPYGFWGIRHTIEQPPSVEGTHSIALQVRGARPSVMAVGLGTGLDRQLTEQHLARLAELRPSIVAERHDSRAALVDALARPDLPLIYFYCHGRRQRLPGAVEPVPYLELGPGERITPTDLTALHDQAWAASHWANTSPLVFINSCHSVEITPGSLTQFVDAFSGIYAAGVIGVETVVTQSLASTIAERFWVSFGAGRTVGEALTDVKLTLLGEGSLLGLAYTAYCSANLRLANG
ncbi:hypothetical protein J5X84_41240 [Streptosporangiaceae bacterium NEAU-GS5]|nr:hypothetical protein [Streptosporangiaceae bacterium NEAU-GS5]